MNWLRGTVWSNEETGGQESRMTTSTESKEGKG